MDSDGDREEAEEKGEAVNMERDRPDVVNPGSREARREGCTCASMDNHHGKGRWGDGDRYGWFITEGCTLHDPRVK